MTTSSINDIDVMVELACADITTNSIISASDKDDSEKIYAVLSAMPASTPLDRANYIDRIQQYLSKNAFIERKARFTWVPPQQKLIREEDAASGYLDFQKLWSKSLEICVANTKAKKDSRLSDDCRAGLLILALAVECGALSAAEIKAVLVELASTGIRSLGRLVYVTTPYRSSATPHGTLDSRRLFLSPLAACLACSLTPNVITSVARKPDASLKALGSAVGINIGRLGDLLNSVATGLHFTHFPPFWLLSWMKHDGIYSSCLNEECFLRLNGISSPLSEEGSQANAMHQDASGPEEDDEIAPAFSDVFGKLSKVLRTTLSVDSSLYQISGMRTEITEHSIRHPAIGQLYDWLIYMHQHMKKTSTIRLYFTAAASSVLSFCEKQDLSSLKREDWIFVFERMIDDSISGSRKSNIATALNSLISFINKAYDKDIALLPSGKDVAIANSHIITKQDLTQLCTLIKSPVSPIPIRDQDSATRLALLAWHTGMRRNELMSLSPSSIKQGSFPLLEVKDTEFFKAKSAASLRDIPLAVLKAFGTDAPWILQGTESGYLINAPGSSKPGDPEFEAACEKLMRGINRSLEEVTGSKEITVHSLRHTFCTMLASHLLGRQFNFSLLSRDVPLIDQIYDDMNAYQLSEVLVPPSYAGYGEIQILRDLMGHVSERTTFLHYLHIMDLFRLGLLKFHWIDELEVLCGASGLSTYNMKKYDTAHELTQALLDKCEITVIRPERPVTREHQVISATAHSLLRDFGIISKSLSLTNNHRKLLSHLRLVPDNLSDYRLRFNQIADNSLKLLSAQASADSVLDLRPSDLPERQFAAKLCHNLVIFLAKIDDHDQDFVLSKIINFIPELLASSTGHTSSSVSVRDNEFLGNLLEFTEAIIGQPERHLRFYRRNKSSGQTASHFLNTRDVLQSHEGGYLDFTSLKVKLQFSGDPDASNDIGTFSWLVSMIFISLWNVSATSITSKGEVNE